MPPSVNWATKLGAIQIRNSMLYLCIIHISILLLYFSLGVEKTKYVRERDNDLDEQRRKGPKKKKGNNNKNNNNKKNP